MSTDRSIIIPTGTMTVTFPDGAIRADIAEARPFFNTYDMTRAELIAAWEDTFGVPFGA